MLLTRGYSIDYNSLQLELHVKLSSLYVSNKEVTRKFHYLSAVALHTQLL